MSLTHEGEEQRVVQELRKPRESVCVGPPIDTQGNLLQLYDIRMSDAF
jgi:hypothetical protein